MTSHRTKTSVVPSHDRLRMELGAHEPMPSADDAGPHCHPATGRIVDGAWYARRRWIKEQAKGTMTLNPKACPPWLRPAVERGAAYTVELATRFPDPALAALVRDAATAHTVSTALLSLGAAGDAKALSESRAWMREHRALIRELCALAALSKDVQPPSLESVRKRIGKGEG